MKNRNKKLFIRNTKTKEKCSNDNNNNVQNDDMMQIKKHKGINDKNQKYQCTKIKRIEMIQKSSILSSYNNNSVGILSSMKQNKLHRISMIPKIVPMKKNYTTITQHKNINRAQYTQENKTANKIKTNIEQYNNRRIINDKVPFKSQNPKISTTINLDPYFVRRTNNKDDKNIKNKINTSTTNTNTTLLLQHNNNNNNDIEPNKEPPTTDYTEITTEYIESNNNPKNVIIKNNSSSNNNKNYNISVS